MQNSSSVASRNVVGRSSATTAASASSEWLTAGEAAQYLKIRTRTLLLWVRRGKVKAHALSGTQRHVWRFRREELDAALFHPALGTVLNSTSSSVRSAE